MSARPLLQRAIWLTTLVRVKDGYFQPEFRVKFVPISNKKSVARFILPANYSLQICDVKNRFAFAGSMNRATLFLCEIGTNFTLNSGWKYPSYKSCQPYGSLQEWSGRQIQWFFFYCTLKAYPYSNVCKHCILGTSPEFCRKIWTGIYSDWIWTHSLCNSTALLFSTLLVDLC